MIEERLENEAKYGEDWTERPVCLSTNISIPIQKIYTTYI